MKSYAVPRQSLYLNGELHFEKGRRYEILANIDGKYAVSYGRKDPMICSLWAKEDEGNSYDIEEA